MVHYAYFDAHNLPSAFVCAECVVNVDVQCHWSTTLDLVIHGAVLEDDFYLCNVLCYCNRPLPRAGSSVSSARLLVRPSLFGDVPVLAGVFHFLSVSRFPRHCDNKTTINESKNRRRCNNEHPFLPTSQPQCQRPPLTILRLRSSRPILHTVALGFFLFIFCRKNFISSVHL
ncbi:hypothetical protein T4D_3184 [Trichinella pseudospiralis]|uniref:Uncharacterized protein n=1 Tax=Trichinella pseudospiralis TaxID=6337 RepID=A0A0V1G1Y4_TRIPS|nr:hypothetical protein T4D_3184 [Trichinella pseudospiralis]